MTDLQHPNKKEIQRHWFGGLDEKTQERHEQDETAEILADTEFADALRESIKQADAGDALPWEEVKAELGL